jgi:hypothetical protein
MKIKIKKYRKHANKMTAKKNEIVQINKTNKQHDNQLPLPIIRIVV